MTKGIQYAIAAVQDVMLAQVGVRGGPDFPPDKIAQAEPFSVCMAGTGSIDLTPAVDRVQPDHAAVVADGCAQ